MKDNKVYFSHELIEFENNLPINITTRELGTYPYNWHNALEIILPLDNMINVTVADKDFTLEKEELFIVNRNTIHALTSHEQSKTSDVLMLQIDTEKLHKPAEQIDFSVAHKSK